MTATSITFVNDPTLPEKDRLGKFGITLIAGAIDPTLPVVETPDSVISAVPVNDNDPTLDEKDTPVKVTVSSAKFPHSPSFQAFAPHPVARTEF